MRNSSARCRRQPEQTATCQFQSPQKKTQRVSSLPRLYRLPDDAAGAVRYSRACPSLRARQLPRYREARACSQRAFSKRPPAPHLSASRGPSGNTSPTAKLWNSSGSPATRNTNPTVDCFGSKRLRRFVLESREQAVLHETLSPDSHWLSSLLFVSHICLFTLSEDRGCAGTYG